MVGYQFAKDFNITDPNKKDAAWANPLITEMRTYMEWFVDPKEAALNYDYLYGRQTVKRYKDKFKKPDDMPFAFEPLGVFEKYRNILMAEREKAGIYINLEAIDPSAQADKADERKLLKNRRFIDDTMTGLQQSMGLPPFSMMNEKDKKGGKMFKGNIGLFDELGLNDKSTEDVAYFFKTYFRLDTEIEAEQIVNYFVKYHELQEFLKYWCDDIFAVKALASRVFTNRFTYTPSFRYIKPHKLKWIKGIRSDGKDAKAFNIEEPLTINEFASMLETDLTDEDIDWFLTSANWWNNTTYDGIEFSNGTRRNCNGGEVCSNAIGYDAFKELKIGVGYIEFKSRNAEAQKVGLNRKGAFRSMDIAVDRPLSKNTKYKKQVDTWETTYKSYYVATSQTTQRLYDFGPLTGMVTEGAEDEYSNFSFQVYKFAGQSAVQIARPHIDNIHDAWFRYLWVLNKIKPNGRTLNYNAIVSVAKKLFKQDDEGNAVMKYTKMMNDSIDDFYTNDTANPNLGGGQNPHFERRNSVDDAIKIFTDIIKEQQNEIGEKLGINSIREAYSPSPNDGYKLQMQALAQSRNATEYVSRMIMSVLTNYAKHTLQIVQNLIEFRSSRYHKVLERALGTKTIETVASLKKVPLHKFGIFVDSFNTDLDKKKLQDEAFQAWQNKDIDYKTYQLILAIDNRKKAAQILAYEFKRGEDRKREDAEIAQRNLMQVENDKRQWDYKIKQLEGMLTIGKQTEANKGLISVEQLDGKVKIILKQMGLSAEPDKQNARAEAKLREHQGIKDIDHATETLTG